VLIQEEKVKRENLVILGIPVQGMKNLKTGEIIDSKTTCGMYNPVIYDLLLGEEVHGQKIVSPTMCLPNMKKWIRTRAGNSGKVNWINASVVMPAVKLAPCVIVILASLTRANPSGQIKSRNLR